jgi:hypothetical protein
MPLEVIRAVGPPEGARVLEIGDLEHAVHSRSGAAAPRPGGRPSHQHISGGGREAAIRAHVADEIEANIGRFHESGCFAEPRTHLHERVMRYTPQRYRDLVGSFGKIASSPERAEILAELGPVMGDDPIDVIDIVWVIAARAA